MARTLEIYRIAFSIWIRAPCIYFLPYLLLLAIFLGNKKIAADYFVRCPLIGTKYRRAHAGCNVGGLGLGT